MNKDNGVERGTVFNFEYGNGSKIYGQVLIGGVVFYAVVFKKEFILESPDCLPLLASWTTDAEFFRGKWTSLGVRPLICVHPNLKYKFYINGTCYIETIIDGSRRQATEQEERDLPYKKSVSPVRFEKIVNAYYGHDEWKNHFDELLVQYCPK